MKSKNIAAITGSLLTLIAILFILEIGFSGGSAAECSDGPCCEDFSYKSYGSQPSGYTDEYSCSGSNSQYSTSYVEVTNYYCDGSSSSARSETNIVDSCGECQYCEDGTPYCRNYDEDVEIDTCSVCDGNGGTKKPDDDDSCGTISCSGLNDYEIIGNQDPKDTSYCTHFQFEDITSNRCYEEEMCIPENDPNYCEEYNEETILEAGECEYIKTCNNQETSIENYEEGTSCGDNYICDGEGNCVSELSHKDSELRIHKNGETYKIVLVDINDENATNIRTKINGEVKALRKFQE